MNFQLVIHKEQIKQMNEYLMEYYHDGKQSNFYLEILLLLIFIIYYLLFIFIIIK